MNSVFRGKHLILINFGALASTALFLFMTFQVSRSLTFFWDDYEILRLIALHPVEQIFMNGVGHFGPIWRLFFTAEVFVFGDIFFLYTVTSAVLAAIGYWGFAYSLKPILRSYFWLVIPFSLIYFTSVGVFTQILTAVGSEFTLAFAFAGLSAYVYSRTKKYGWPIGLLTLSGLSLNGSLPTYFSMFAAVVIAHVVYERSSVKIKKTLFILTIGLATTFLWAVTAAVLGALNPSPYYAAAAAITNESVPLGEQVAALLRNIPSLTLSWLAAPFVPGAVISPSLMSRLTIFVVQYLPLFLMASGGLIAVLFFYLKRHRIRGAHKQLLAVGVALVPVVITAAIVAYTRPGAITAPRYGNVWIPAVLLLFLILAPLIIANRQRLSIRVVGVMGATLLVANAAIGVIFLPSTVVEASNSDRPRIALSPSQHALMAECLKTDVVTPIDEISPQLSAQDFCIVARFLYEKTTSSFFDPEIRN